MLSIFSQRIWRMPSLASLRFATGYAFAFGSGSKWLMGTFPRRLRRLLRFRWRLEPGHDIFFQAVFAATAVTIASGAMAERTKFSAYLAFSLVMCAFIYPVVVHWTWGGGLIAQMSIGDAVYSDFAGWASFTWSAVSQASWEQCSLALG